MRTTLTIDDDVLERLHKEASRARVSFKTVVNRALRLGLDRLRPSRSRQPFRQRTFRLGYPPSTSLDKALQLAAMLEDEEVARKLELRK